MSNSYFQFKKFTIRHDKCAMKVGTDSVLLGAWAPVFGRSVLDIGCGTGILSILLASRVPDLAIYAVDIDASAVEQTMENAHNTPWGKQITAQTIDIRKWESTQLFDTILSNPPFYPEQTLPPSEQRSLARNTCSLNYRELVECVVNHLSPDGLFSVILPISSEMIFRGLAVEYGLHPVRSLTVTTVEGKMPKRILMAYTLQNIMSFEEKQTLCIRNSSGDYSSEYSQLVGDYYLKL